MLKVNNKDTRTTSTASFWCLYCYLSTYFTSCSSDSIVNFENVSTNWVWIFNSKYHVDVTWVNKHFLISQCINVIWLLSLLILLFSFTSGTILQCTSPSLQFRIKILKVWKFWNVSLTHKPKHCKCTLLCQSLYIYLIFLLQIYLNSSILGQIWKTRLWMSPIRPSIIT